MKLVIAILLSSIIAGVAGLVTFTIIDRMIRYSDPTISGVTAAIVVFGLVIYKIAEPIFNWIKKDQ